MSSQNMEMNDVVLENLRSQRASGAFCDVKIEMGCHNLWVHSAVVCPFSGYLDKYKENVNVRMNVHNECLQCLEYLLDVMYGLDVNIPESHWDHVREYCRLLMTTNEMLESLTKMGLDLKLNLNVPPMEEQSEARREDIDDDHFEYYQETDDLDAIKFEAIRPPERIAKRVRQDEESDSLLRKKSRLQNESICLECDFRCPQVDALYRHLQETNHGSKSCSICMETLPDGKTLEDHLPSHSHLAPFPCLNCGLRFSEKSNMMAHNVIHKIRCLECERTYPELESLFRHLQSTNHSSGVCSICNKSLHDGETLEEHLSLHSDLVPFKCTHCDLRFKLESKLLNHIAGHSKNQCLECRRKFQTAISLCMHLKNTNHSSDVCSVCNKTLCHGETLQRHLNLHTNERAFACPHCGMRFKSKGRANFHIAKHNVIVCLECKQKFSAVDDLYRHLQQTNHGGSEGCSICKEPLPKWVTIKEHLTLHSKLAPIACPQCGLRFKKKKTMFAHMKCH